MKVVIIGGGFGGLSACRALEGVDVEVTLIDRRNFHLFQPLLYQVATGALSPANIAAPLRSVLRKQSNVTVVLGTVTGFNLTKKQVLLTDRTIEYDVLIVATGSTYNYFGHGEWQAEAPSLKTIEEATDIRGRILRAFEEAELDAEDESWMTFVVIGGGPTGVEMAGAIAEVARHTLPADFKHIRAANARILLLEADSGILGTFHPSLARHAEKSLDRLGVEVRVHTRVTGVDERGVTVSTAAGESHIEARTVVWAAGVVGTSTGRDLAESAGQELAPSGRIRVTPQLNLPGLPDVFVLGDLAFLEQNGKPLPALAPIAIQQGEHVAAAIKGRLAGTPAPAFRYKDRGTMATIGRSAAIADLGFVRLHGFPGWVTWLFVHLMLLVHFENRVLVLTQWAWNYFTRARSARLITGRPAETDEAPHPDGA